MSFEHLNRTLLEERINTLKKDITSLERQAKATQNKYSHNTTLWNSYLSTYFNVLEIDCTKLIESLDSLIKDLNNLFGNGLVDLNKIHSILLIVEMNFERMRYSFAAIHNTLDDFDYYLRKAFN